MIVERTQDPELIKCVFSNPQIFATVAEDGQSATDIEPDMNRNIWLVMKDGSDVVALYQVERLNGITAQIHANVLPQYRKIRSKETGRLALDWVMEHLPDIHKLIAVVPVIYPNVRDFTCSFGFREEGLNRESYLKNGEIHDQWILGITRPEIGEQRWAA